MDNIKGHDTKEKFEGIKIEYLIIMEYGKSKLKRKELEDLLIDLNELSAIVQVNNILCNIKLLNI